MTAGAVPFACLGLGGGLFFDYFSLLTGWLGHFVGPPLMALEVVEEFTFQCSRPTHDSASAVRWCLLLLVIVFFRSSVSPLDRGRDVDQCALREGEVFSRSVVLSDELVACVNGPGGHPVGAALLLN